MAEPGARLTRRHFVLASALLAAGCARESESPRNAGVTARAQRTVEPSAPAPAHSLAKESKTVDPAGVVTELSGRQPTAWGMDIAGIIRNGPADAVALTFDACGGPGGSRVDTELIDLLRSRGVKATLFLNKRWIEANLGYARELAQDPLFQLANHGTRHCPLSVTGRSAYGIAGTRTVSEAVDEVAANHEYMAQTLGAAPRYFRAGTAHYDDVGVAACQAFGESPVGFTINGDAGATFSADQIIAEVCRARGGDIVISHMNQPDGATAEGYREALARLTDAGVTFTHLA
ncbi:MAG: polysaccharide deacetylase family protein [Actinomycetaceae bacterium]|nr:polysaccharide deacetylase family protein [Actinomycetaceae bacterium]